MPLLTTGTGVYPAIGGVATTTWNPADKSASITLSGGDLIATSGANAFIAARGIASHSSGKYYYEVTINVLLDVNGVTIGFANSSALLTNFIGQNNNGVGLIGNGQIIFNGSVATTVAAYAATNVVAPAIDFDNQKIWYRTNNGNWNNDVIGNQNPATNTGGQPFTSLAAGPYFPAISLESGGDQFTANFGATAYSGTPPSGFGNW